MNSLTVNLHLLVLPFYNPTAQRHKILMEAKAFPSDYYALQSQIRLKGFDPSVSLLEMKARDGEDCIREEDVLQLLKEQGHSIALVMMPGLSFSWGGGEGSD